ncbi:hypothetical protein RI367_005793 [Sorochytrium milnesiophthora]
MAIALKQSTNAAASTRNAAAAATAAATATDAGATCGGAAMAAEEAPIAMDPATTHVVILSPSRCAERAAQSASKESASPLTLSSEYGKDDAVLELQTLALERFASAEIRPISLDNWVSVVADLANKLAVAQEQPRDNSDGATRTIVVLNLCDGTETDGYPGISVIKGLEQAGIPFTGSGSDFFDITTSKPVLKRYLQEKQVPTSGFYEILNMEGDDDPLALQTIDAAIADLGLPLIVKPSVSYASVGITSSSVVRSRDETVHQVRVALKESMGGGVFLEQFLAGREFTAVVVGDAKQGVRVFEVAERQFDSKIPQNERFLAFDRYWEGYSLEGSTEAASLGSLYNYVLAPPEWQERLKQIAGDAYLACNGSGYGRVDLRTTNNTDCEAFVLEVNANCGLSFAGGASSLGEVMRLSDVPPSQFVQSLADFAVTRWHTRHHAQ